MDMNEAVIQRHSVRKYTGEPLSDGAVQALEREIDRINSESGLDVRLVTDDAKAFSGMTARFCGFSDVPAYVAMCGTESPDLNENVGYYGEQIVLLAQSMGLRSCWAMVCSKKQVESQIPFGEKMVIGIALGFGADDGKPHKSKPAEKVTDIDDSAPLWFMKGVELALLAPTGMNKQAFHLSLEGDKVRAVATGNWMSQIDLGIVKLHFEIGSGRDHTVWL